MTPLAPRPAIDAGAAVDPGPCWACAARPAPVSVAPVDGLYRCGACGLLYRPVGRRAVAGLYTDAYFDAYAGGPYLRDGPLRRHEARERLRWMAACGVRPAGVLLEVGAAAGHFVAEASAAGWRASGVEPAGSLAAYARERLGADVATGFVEDLEPASAEIDAVVLWHVLEHIPEPLPTLERLARALVPGGHLMLEVPNAASLMARRRGWAWAPWELDVHVAHYTPAAISALLARAGLGSQRVQTVPFLTYVAGRRRRLPRHLLLALRQRGVSRSAHELLRVCAVKGST